MSDVRVIVRDPDNIRKAEITLSRIAVGADIVQTAVDKWQLPADGAYILYNATQSRPVHEENALTEDVVRDGDVLEVRPALQGA